MLRNISEQACEQGACSPDWHLMALRSLALLALLDPIAGDVYMQYPPGANNRLEEGGGNRNNNNRLMDSQNNAKGGYGYGGSANNQAAPISYMAGSKLSMTWTSQHSCGSENAECQVVIQYMCASPCPYSHAPTSAEPREGDLERRSTRHDAHPRSLVPQV